jgi:predicted nucleotidyltransferase
LEIKDELVKLCRALNGAGVRYVVIGGCAIALHGYFRTTQDIDLLVDPDPENIRRMKEALHRAYGSEEILGLGDGEVAQYAVVRFAPASGEVVIDLIGRVGEVTFETAVGDVEELVLDGSTIPLCGLSTLIETKRGVRPRDQEDLLFLLGKKEYLEQGE